MFRTALADGTVDLLNAYGGKVSWRSEPDSAKPTLSMPASKPRHRLRIMAYLNSDDTLLPGTLAYIAHVFQTDQTSILSTDIEYLSTGRIGNWAGGLSAHDANALLSRIRPRDMFLGRSDVKESVGGREAERPPAQFPIRPGR